MLDAQTGNTDIEGTLAVNGSATLRSTLNVAAVSTLQDDLLLSEDAAVIKHSVGAGSTTAGLSILSEHYHVDVESVRFTDNTIGIAADPDLLTLTNAALAVAGTLTVSDDVKLSEDAAVITTLLRYGYKCWAGYLKHKLPRGRRVSALHEQADWHHDRRRPHHPGRQRRGGGWHADRQTM